MCMTPNNCWQLPKYDERKLASSPSSVKESNILQMQILPEKQVKMETSCEDIIAGHSLFVVMQC